MKFYSFYLFMVGLYCTLSQKIKCFSCMSEIYKQRWDYWSKIYIKPANFSDICTQDVGHKDKITLVPCDSICVKLWEDVSIDGVCQRAMVRGCLDTTLVNGFNELVVEDYGWIGRRIDCHQYDRNQLFGLTSEDHSEGQVIACPCGDDACNGSWNEKRTRRNADDQKNKCTQVPARASTYPLTYSGLLLGLVICYLRLV